jgi:hypothetical protein
MTNPVLTVGGPSITVAVEAVLVSVTFADLLWWPTTSSENLSDAGLALSVANTGDGEAVGVGRTVGVAVALAVTVGAAVEVAVMLAVGVAVTVGVPVALPVGVAVTVAVAVAVALAVAIAVGVGPPLPSGNIPNTASCVCVPM